MLAIKPLWVLNGGCEVGGDLSVGDLKEATEQFALLLVFRQQWIHLLFWIAGLRTARNS
jgi:hypothetical protein